MLPRSYSFANLKVFTLYIDFGDLVHVNQQLELGLPMVVVHVAPTNGKTMRLYIYYCCVVVVVVVVTPNPGGPYDALCRV